MTDATSYVVGFLLNASSGCVLLVRKTRPAWQHGRLNGIGGKIEAGEAPEEAMIREWLEETGLDLRYCPQRLFARVRGDGYDVYFFMGIVRSFAPVKMQNDVGECLEWWQLSEVTARMDIISNLKWLLPLAFEDDGSPYADVTDSIAPPRHTAQPLREGKVEKGGLNVGPSQVVSRPSPPQSSVPQKSWWRR